MSYSRRVLARQLASVTGLTFRCLVSPLTTTLIALASATAMAHSAAGHAALCRFLAATVAFLEAFVAHALATLAGAVT